MNEKSMTNDDRLYELRTYFANPGMLDRLVSRFENHTFRFFAKHQMQVVGLWLPLDNPENKLVYILSFANQKASDKSWKDFKSDPEWIAIKEESSRDGELLASLKSVFMHPLDSSPGYLTTGGNHVFELQTYKNTPHNQELLRHGVNTFKSWETWDQEGEESNLLICLLSHQSQDERQEANEPAISFLSAFVKSEYLRAVSFSPLR